jgi:hypothetical protein
MDRVTLSVKILYQQINKQWMCKGRWKIQTGAGFISD